MIDCIQPVLTKCNPNDENIDINSIRAELLSQFMLEIQNSDVMALSKQVSQTDEEFGINDLRKFYQDFASKLVIFDPLDRPVPTNNNQAISREDLVQTIGSMKSISGGDVYAPFSSKHLNLFDDMIGKEYEHCNKVVNRCIEEAEEQGEHYDFNLLNERAFEALERSLRYFAEKNLLLDGEKRLIKFYDYVANQSKIVTQAKMFRELEDQSKEVLKAMQNVNASKNQKKYADLVGVMIELQSKINQYLKENGIGEELDNTKTGRVIRESIMMIEEVVQELSSDAKELVKFAYELRRQDTEDRYSMGFLSGQVKPPTLVDIIMSNKWSTEENRMTVD